MQAARSAPPPCAPAPDAPVLLQLAPDACALKSRRPRPPSALSLRRRCALCPASPYPPCASFRRRPCVPVPAVPVLQQPCVPPPNETARQRLLLWLLQTSEPSLQLLFAPALNLPAQPRLCVSVPVEPLPLRP